VSGPVRLGLALLLGLGALVLLPAFPPDKTRIDFETAVYYPARAFLDGLDPYDQGPYLARYPVQAPFPPFLPAALLLHAPLALLPVGPSSAVYLCLSLALVVVSARLALGFAHRPPRSSTVITIAALVLLSRPGRLALRLGQLSFEPVSGTYAALWFGQRSPWLGGAGLFVASIKPTFGVPLALLMLARRQVRSVIIGAGLILTVNAAVATILINRAGGTAAFTAHVAATFDSARQGIVETSNPIMTGLRTDAASFIGRLQGRPLRAGMQALVGLVVLGAAAGVLLALERRGVPLMEGVPAGFICVAILLSQYHQAYDLSLLILPAVVMVLGPPDTVPPGRSARLALAGLFLLLGANYLASEGALARLSLARETAGWRVVTAVNAAALLLAYTIYAATLIHSLRRTKADVAELG
jgi:hypothetical protein